MLRPFIVKVSVLGYCPLSPIPISWCEGNNYIDFTNICI